MSDKAPVAYFIDGVYNGQLTEDEAYMIKSHVWGLTRATLSGKVLSVTHLGK